jgi:predicted kinase
MNTIYVCMGLPASGKTTWSREFSKENPNTIIICKDDIRLEHPNWTENQVIGERDRLISNGITNEHDIIVADTNLNPIHLRSIIKEYRDKAIVRVKSFLDVPMDECIRRDKGREKAVGADVIRHMYNQYREMYFFNPVKQDDSLPKAVICDLDGTLAIHNRSPFDYKRIPTDSLNKTIAETLEEYKEHGYQIVYLSGRPDTYRQLTEDWLKEKQVPTGLLFMRRENDTRDDSIVKRELFMNNLFGKFNVVAGFDDRCRVLRMWKQLGLNVTDVGYGIEF